MTVSRPRRRGDVKSETLPDGSAVLYDTGAKMAYPLTISGAQIWEACDGTRTVETIVEELLTTYEASAETIERDVRAFLDHLAESRLLEADAEARE